MTRSSARRPLDILHIGKTGGNALAHALLPHLGDRAATFHGHDRTLRDVPEGHQVIFLVRHPVPRFVSGFNSRLRQGQPRHFVAWSPDEARIFSLFPTPGALAEGLAAAEPARRLAATQAIGTIYHPARKLAFWLESAEYVMQRRRDIVFIGATETLDRDFPTLLRVLELDPAITLPGGTVDRHATPAGFETQLSAEAHRSISSWYEQDFPIYEACLYLREQIIREAGTRGA